MDFYTFVSKHKGKILVRGYERGMPVTKIEKFKPVLYQVTQKETKYRSMFGDKLEPINFNSLYQAEKFFHEFKHVGGYELFGMERFIYQYIARNWPDDVKYDSSIIDLQKIDIETDSEDGYANISEADKAILSITVKSSKSPDYLVFGLVEYDPQKTELNIDPNHINYILCEDEEDMLLRFLEHWKENYPDIITGWNSRLYDIPYIVNRVRRILGEDVVSVLSPFGLIRAVETNDKFNNTTYDLVGIVHLDYMEVFKKFSLNTLGRQESYSLDNISHVVLKERKLDYSEYKNLNTLYKTDPQKFIDYNIKDVVLIQRLEDKLGYIGLVMAISYKAKSNLIDALGTVQVWDNLIYNHLRKQNIVIPCNKPHIKERQNEGAFVKNPKPGMYNWIVSFDVRSLYPSIMLMLNISPDTLKSKKFHSFSIEELLKFPSFEIPEDVCVAANGRGYSNDRRGVIPFLLNEYLNERAEIKVILKDLEKKEENGENVKTEISLYDNKQMAIKILMNSVYGAISNEFFRYFLLDMAESVTITGQFVIKWAEKNMNTFINKFMKTDDIDYIVGMDTDSLYINFEDIVAKFCSDKTFEETLDFIDNLCKKVFADVFEKMFKKLASYMNCPSNEIFMNREVIADKGIWTAKKRYVLNVWDKEGIRYNEPSLKIKGLESARSSTPQICRDKIKETLKTIITTDEKTTQKFIKEFKDKFKTLPIMDVASPITANGLEKYSSKNEIYTKGTPIHVKGALIFNNLLEKLDLSTKYQQIFEGEKIKFIYLKEPNPFKNKVIGFKDFIPEEFEMEKYIDYNRQFERTYMKPIRSILDSIGWDEVNKPTLKGLL